ncbi:MAG: 4Fe-4S binding protein [Deltaproteobacteria bacterium]|nr:4Fe-4S binding protein [Deltaproteobacteria bacterium]
MREQETMQEPATEQDFSLKLDDLRPRAPEKKTFFGYFMPPRHSFILFDPEKCTGCGACEMICSTRNTEKVAPTSASVKVVTDETQGKTFAILCQHCRKPFCLEACPTRAIEKGEDGIVRIDRLFCTDCGLCTLACPAAAPLKDPGTQSIHKCDLCEGDPLCVKYCPENALTFTRGKAFRWIKGLRWTIQFISFLLLVMVFVGTFCYFKAGEVTLSCPTGTLQNIASTGTILLIGGITSALALLILTILAGRLFCGWVCPFGFVLDLVDKITPKKLGWPSFLKSRMTKYGVLAGAVGGSYALGFQAFCTICPIGTLCRSYGVQSFFKSAELAIVPALASLEIAQRRSWCRYFCPVGALLGLTATLRLIKIVIGAKKCKKFSCIQCAEVCPVGIIEADQLREGISPKIPMTECIMCLRCIDRCPYGAAKICFRWQKATPGEDRP